MAGLRITLRGCHKKRGRPLPRVAFVETQCPALQLGWCGTCAGLCLRISLSGARVIAADALVSHFVRSCCAAAARPEGESSWRELAFEHTAQQRPISKMSAVPDQPLGDLLGRQIVSAEASGSAARCSAKAARRAISMGDT